MEFGFNINNLLADVITKLDSSVTPSRKNADGYDHHALRSQLLSVTDKMGEASSKAQGLSNIITTGRKLQISDHNLYVIKDASANGGKGAIVGILKTGHKKLFVYNHHGDVKEMEPLCVLDFYVHESRQRMGCGRKLFDYMLQSEGVRPQHLAIDRPSFKFSQFLAKHYNLRGEVPQVNNFVIFEGFFEANSSDIRRRKSALGRPPSHPNRRKDAEGDAGLKRQITYNGYSLPPLHPGSRPDSGTTHTSSTHSTPRREPHADYSRHRQLRPISGTSDRDGTKNDRKVSSTVVNSQGQRLYSRHGNTTSPAMSRPESGNGVKPQTQLLMANSNINANTNSNSNINANGNSNSNLNANGHSNSNLNANTNSNSNHTAAINDPRLFSKNRTPVERGHSLNLHQEYQGRRGHIRVNRAEVQDLPIRNPFLPREEDVASRPKWGRDRANWTVFNKSPGYLTIAQRNQTHTRLW